MQFESSVAFIVSHCEFSETSDILRLPWFCFIFNRFCSAVIRLSSKRQHLSQFFQDVMEEQSKIVGISHSLMS